MPKEGLCDDCTYTTYGDTGEYPPLLLAYVQARGAYVQARDAYYQALDARDEVWGAWRSSAECTALHAAQCPGCPWDGKTIFPEVRA